MQPEQDSGPEATRVELASVQTRRVGDALVVTGCGEFDSVSTPQLKLALQEAVHETPLLLVVDLTDVQFFGSVALATLAQLRQEQVTLRLAVGHTVRRILGLMGMEEVFALYDSVADALAAGSS